MDISKEVTSTLRANAEGHPPVICVEYCGDKTDASCSTETAYCIPKNPVDGRQQAVCFTQNQREEVRELGGSAGTLTAERGMHNTNYVVCPGVGITSPQNANNPQPGDPCPTLTEDSRNYLVGKIEGVQPCLTGAFMGGQGAKARSIAWCADGTTPTLKSAPSGGNTIPDVVYPVNLMVATRGGRDDMRTCFGIGDANDPQFTLSSAHEHGVCYEVDEGG